MDGRIRCDGTDWTEGSFATVKVRGIGTLAVF